MNRPLVSDKSDCGHDALHQHSCWHGPCRVTLLFRNGDMWLRNKTGYAQLYRPDQVREVS